MPEVKRIPAGDEQDPAAPRAVRSPETGPAHRPPRSEERAMRFAKSTVVTAALLAACVAPPTGRFQPPGDVDPVAARYINPGTLTALPGFTHAVRIGPTVYVSGEIALDSTGHLVGPGDLRAPATPAVRNLAPALPVAGAAPAHR